MIGNINGLFGTQGWVKIFSHTQPRKNVLSYQPWHIKTKNNWQTLTIIQGREQAKTIVAKISGINDHEQARGLIGTDIYIQKSQLPKLQQGSYYWQDLIGLTVVNQKNTTLGKVSNLFATGANTVLVVSGKKEYLIPYIAQFLIAVDIDNQQIEVDWDEDF